MSDEQVQGQIQVGSVFEWIADSRNGLTKGRRYEVTHDRITHLDDRVLFFVDDNNLGWSYVLTPNAVPENDLKWISHPTGTPTESTQPDDLPLLGDNDSWVGPDTQPATEQVEIDDGGPAYPVNGPAGHHPGMSVRQYAAIHLCVPESGVEWLNDMIRKSQRDHFAGQVLASGQIPKRDDHSVVDIAIIHADSLLKKIADRKGGSDV